MSPRLIWQPLLLEAGIQGNENDRGAYALTRIYQHPYEFLLPHHQGLFDGVFKGPLHSETSDEDILPANASELAHAPTTAARNQLNPFPPRMLYTTSGSDIVE